MPITVERATWCLRVNQKFECVGQTGILLRAAGRGYLPDRSFVVVTLAFTGVLLIGWRTVLAFALPKVLAQAHHKKRTCPIKDLVAVSPYYQAIMLTGTLTFWGVQIPSADDSGSAGQGRNRKGNPFEFLQLLTSLVKRW